MTRIVEAADLIYPWNCESCKRDFVVGDVVYGEMTGFIGDTIVEEHWVCADCREAEWSDGTA